MTAGQGDVISVPSVTGGSESVRGPAQTTDDDGIAQVGGWTLGATPGTNTLEARAGSSSTSDCFSRVPTLRTTSA
jgi:hypothetical protein